MLSINRNSTIRTILFIFIMITPLVVQTQSRTSEVKALHREIDKLSDMVTKLKAEQHRSYRIDSEIHAPSADYDKRDSLRIIQLKRKQAESRARIDQLTLDILKISKQLEDPNKRYALAKKLREPRTENQQANSEPVTDSTQVTQVVSARSIDLAAVKMIREGKSLDQARLLTIDGLSQAQVLAFYQDLDKESRYELYDIADEIVASEKVELVDARRSAIYFYLFTK